MPDTRHPHFEEVGELRCGRPEFSSRLLVPHFADQAHQSLDVSGLNPMVFKVDAATENYLQPADSVVRRSRIAQGAPSGLPALPA
jgi:hypothetical protein